MANDPSLGVAIHEVLVEMGIETPMTIGSQTDLATQSEKFGTIEKCHSHIMHSLGLDLNDDSLQDTPKRIAKMYCNEIFTGLDYAQFPKCTTVENKMHYDEMVCVRNIEVKSMCEHHFLPFTGTAHIAYIPRQKVLGLSKFNRVTDFFSRRPQIQERLTEQIAAALSLILDTEDIAVVIKAKHYCVSLRGVQDSCSDTVTSKLSGRFRNNSSLRAEFLSIAHG